MFEEYTSENILEKMLGNVSDEFDKREGSVIYDALAPTALQLEEVFSLMDMVLEEGFADTASYHYLIKRAAERGLFPEEETYAVVKMVAVPDTVQIAMGDKFNLGDLNYTVTSIMDTAGEYQLTCDTAGSSANQQLGELIPIETENDMNDLQSASITEILIPGEDEEDEEVFRERYFASFESEAYGGNVADYIDKVNKIDGVGGVKVSRKWKGGYNPSDFIPSSAVSTWYDTNIDTLPSGVKEWLTAVYTSAKDKYLTVGGTVSLVVIASDWGVPSQTLLDAIQNIVDPDDDTGNGVGIAPIGHVVSVDGVTTGVINVELIDAEYDSGYSFATLKSAIEESIDAYFTDLRKDWANSESIVVRVSQLTSTLLSVEGIIDIGAIKLNGQSDNITLDSDEIPERGDVIG